MEGTYTHVVARHPIYMESKGPACSSASVFSSVYAFPRLIVPHDRFKPELAMRCERPGRPPLSFEWKSFPQEGFDALAQTTLGQLQDSFFRSSSWIFYAQPPWGLAALACASALVMVFAAELVGVLHFSVYAGACNVGDAVYNHHVDTLENSVVISHEKPVDLEAAIFTCCPDVGARVQWTMSPVDGFFFKVLRYDLYAEEVSLVCPLPRGHNWRRLHSVYQHYGRCAVADPKTLTRAPGLPPALVPARLLYGEFQVAVQLPFLPNVRQAENLDELDDHQRQLIVDALLFLLQQGLIYTDLRAPNVLVREGEAFLIDYDDLEIVQGSLELPLAKVLAECKEGATIWQQVLKSYGSLGLPA